MNKCIKVLLSLAVVLSISAFFFFRNNSLELISQFDNTLTTPKEIYRGTQPPVFNRDIIQSWISNEFLSLYDIESRELHIGNLTTGEWKRVSCPISYEVNKIFITVP